MMHKIQLWPAVSLGAMAFLGVGSAQATDLTVSGGAQVNGVTLTGTDTLTITETGALDVPLTNGLAVVVDAGATNVSIFNDGLIDGYFPFPGFPAQVLPTILFTAPSGSLLTIENNGLIEGLTVAIGVTPSGLGAVDLTNSGEINGYFHPALALTGPIAINLGAGDDVFTSAGTVRGHVFMGLGDDTVNFHAGSTLDGGIFGGDGRPEINPALGTTTADLLVAGDDTINFYGNVYGSSTIETDPQEIGNIELFTHVNFVSGYWWLTDNVHGGIFTVGEGATVEMYNSDGDYNEFVYTAYNELGTPLTNNGHIIFYNDLTQYSTEDGLNINIEGTGSLDLYNTDADSGVFYFGASGGFGGGLNLHGGTVLIGSDYAGDINVFDGGILRIGGNLEADPDNPGMLNLTTGGGTSGNIVGDVDIDGTLILDRSDDFTFSADITGNGLIVKEGAGTATLSGTFNFSGDMDIVGGLVNLTGDITTNGGTTSIGGSQLNVNGSMSSDLEVGSGGTLGGSGTINGDVSVGAGGAVGPGNSPGTLDVVGNFTFETGSTYEIETLPNGVSDRIAVTGGGVTIETGATASVLAGGTAYNWQTNYTILTSTGGISGAFDTLTSDLAFLDASLAYTNSAITLTLTRNDVDFEDVAETPNQQGVAGALGGLPHGDDVLLAILNSGEADAADNYDQLSGEAHASTQSAGLTGSNAFLGQLHDRLAGLSEGPQLVQVASLSTDAGAPGQPQSHLWGEMFGSAGSLDGNGGAAGLDFDRAGLSVGFDAAPGPNSRLGVAVSYHNSDVDVSDRSSNADVEAYDVAVYGGVQGGGLVWRGALGYSMRSIESDRDVVVGMLTEHLTADYDARAISAEVEVARPFAGELGRVEPFLGLAHVALDTDGFTETGGSSALTAADARAAATFATLGVRGAYDLMGGALFGSLGWRHAWGDIAPETQMMFSSNPGASFTVASAPIAEDAALIEAGFAIDVGKVLLEASYRGEVANDAEDHGGRVRATWRF